ncbi:MAG: Ribonuclease HII, partial [uncultured Acetobacteraceae bacterium]
DASLRVGDGRRRPGRRRGRSGARAARRSGARRGGRLPRWRGARTCPPPRRQQAPRPRRARGRLRRAARRRGPRPNRDRHWRRLRRRDRTAEHPPRHPPRHGPRRGAAAAPAGPGPRGRQPAAALVLPGALRCRRRRALPFDRRRLHRGEGGAGPGDGAARGALAGLRIRRPCRIPHGAAPAGVGAAWCVPAPPPRFPPRGAGDRILWL